MVAERKSEAPYRPNVFEIDWENPLDLVELLKIGTDECKLDASLIEQFSSELIWASSVIFERLELQIYSCIFVVIFSSFFLSTDYTFVAPEYQN